MLKISFEPPKLGFAEDIKNVLRGQEEKRRNQAKKVFAWTNKDRLLVLAVLLLTVLASLLFSYRGYGKLPKIKFNGFSETVTLEK
jgi:hypothetical protein